MAEVTLPPVAPVSADPNTTGSPNLPQSESVGDGATPTATPIPRAGEGGDEGGGKRGEAEKEPPGLSSERVNQLSRFLHQQQEVVYR